VEQLSQIPGVISVAATTDLPLHGFFKSAAQIEGPGGDKRNAPAVLSSWTIGDFLKTMGIPLLRGRPLTPEDRQGTQPVALINQGMARQFWPNEDALGKRVFAVGKWFTVVGIVGDVHDGPLSAEPTPHVYRPYLQSFGGPDAPQELVETARRMSFAVRTQGDPGAASAVAVSKLHGLDPAIAVADVRAMGGEVRESLAPQRFNAALVGIYAGLALLLAVVGIYGVLAYMVTQQTHEMGIRMALGAQRRDMFAYVLFRGARLVILGAAIGLLGAAIVTRFLVSLLFGVSSHDPATFVGVPIVLAAVAMLACYLPALRATRVDPMVALRYE
jgi:putative ABC transport system permease protein